MEKQIDPVVADWIDRRLAEALETMDETAPDIDIGLQRLRRGRAKLQMRRVRRTWVMSGLAAVLAAVVILPGSRAYAVGCVEACVAGSDRLAQFVLSKLRPGESRLSVNHQARDFAPDFELTDGSGKTIRLSTYRGQVIALNFWATWCPPCRVEIPWFIEFQRKHEARGFTVLGVSMDEDGWAAVRPYLESHGINYPIVIGDSGVLQSYGGLESLPTTLIIDRRGRVAATHVGLVSKSVYERDILSALRESE